MSTISQSTMEPTEDELLLLVSTSLLRGEVLGIKMAFKKITSSKHATKILRKLFKLLTLKRTTIREALKKFVVNSNAQVDNLPNTWTPIEKFKNEQLVVNTIAAEVLSRKHLFDSKKITTFDSPGNNLLIIDNKLLREMLDSGLLEISQKFSIYGGSKKTDDLATSTGGMAANLNQIFYDFGFINFGGPTGRDAIYTFNEVKDIILNFINNTNENISLFRDIYLSKDIMILEKKQAGTHIFLHRQKFLNNFLGYKKIQRLFRTTFLIDRSPIKDSPETLTENLIELNSLVAESMLKYTKEDLNFKSFKEKDMNE